MRYKGTINNWRDDKGFGFITPNGGGKHVFVHINSFINRLHRPLANETVTYSLRNDASGRPQAEAVLFAGEHLRKTAPSGFRNVPALFVSIFIIVLTAMAFTHMLPLMIVWRYCITSLLAFIAYGMDKSAAKNQGWRTPESTLHLLALAGGWPGAFAAQRVLRHKSSKRAFQNMFWITVALNCIGLGWLLTVS